jgi:hypothetical protein
VFRLAERPEVLAEFLCTVMDRNLSFRQQSSKGELADCHKIELVHLAAKGWPVLE